MKENTILTDRQDNRLYLDIVKGVAIFLMLWGHCIQYCTNGEFDFFENPIFKFIYSFHMPLFTLVSGYLFYYSCKKRKFSQLLIHRTQSLLQPIILCSVFNYYITVPIIDKTPSSLFGNNWLTKFGSLWFLWSILAASIVVSFSFFCCKRLYQKILIISVGCVVMLLFPNYDFNLYLYPFFVLGFAFAKNKEKIPEIVLKAKYVFLIVFPIMLSFYQKKHFIYTTGIVSSDRFTELIMIDIYRWAIGFVGSIFMMVILELLHRMVFVKRSTLAKPLASLGVKSLQIYCVSVSILSFWLPKLYGKICSMIGSNVFATNMAVYNCVFTPILAIVYAVLLYYIVVLLETIKVSKVLFGR